MNLAKNMRKLRQERKMTLKEIARHLGVPASTYRDWEYGSKVPAETLVQIAQLFEVSVNDILGLENVQGKNRQQAIHLIEEGLRLLKRG